MTYEFSSLLLSDRIEMKGGWALALVVVDDVVNLKTGGEAGTGE